MLRILLLIPVLMLFCLEAGCSSRKDNPANPPPTSAAADTDLITVDPDALKTGRIGIYAVRMAKLPDVLSVTGKIGVDENRTSRVGSIADGRVVSVLSNVGDWVKQGQRLAELQSHEVDIARSEFTKARAELDRRRAELQFARNAHKRAARLYELKAGSLEQLQRAETDLRSAEMAITAAEADVGRVEEHLQHLGLSAEGAMEEYSEARERRAGKFEQSELIPVVAPLSGTVLKRMVSPGTVVTPSNDLFVVSDLSNLWVNAEVPEKYLARLKLGLQVKVYVQAYGTQPFLARITQIGDTLDPDTRTVQVRCQTDNRSMKLKPEMYATVGFDLGGEQGTLAIPTESIQEINGSAIVFLQETEVRFRLCKVRVGRQVESLSEILEGLKPGDSVVSTGSFLLKSELLKKQMTEE